MRKFYKFMILMSFIFIISCFNSTQSLRTGGGSASDPNDGTIDNSASNLNISTEIVADLKIELTKSTDEGGGGLSEAQANVITNGALEIVMPSASLALSDTGDPNDVTYAAPKITEGAVSAISKQEAGISSNEDKIKIVSVISSAITKSLHNKLDGVDEDKAIALPAEITCSAIGALDEGGIDEQYIAGAAKDIANKTIGNLNEAGFSDKTKLQKVLSTIAEQAIPAFKNAGILGGTQYEDVIDNFMEGTTGAINDAGISNLDDYKNMLDGITRSAMKGLKDTGFDSNGIYELLDDMTKGAVAGFGNQSEENISSLAASLNYSAITGLDDLAITDANIITAASQKIADGTMKSMANFSDKHIISKDKIRIATQNITKEAAKALYNIKEKRNFSDFSTISCGFSKGLASGLLEAGWKTDEINASNDYIKHGFNMAVQDEPDFNSSWVTAMGQAANTDLKFAKNICYEKRGIWDATTSMCRFPSKVALTNSSSQPTEDELKKCHNNGGEIRWFNDGKWFCDILEGINLNTENNNSDLCSLYVEEDMCSIDRFCYWDQSSCRPQTTILANQFVDPNSCISHNFFWSWIVNGCFNSEDEANNTTVSFDWCRQNDDQTNCESSTECFWDTAQNQCQMGSSDKFTTRITCQNAGFYWSGSSCQKDPVACSTSSLQGNPDLCIANGCQYDNGEATCADEIPEGCWSNADQNSCKADSQCYWDGNNCIDAGCFNYTNEDTCNDHSLKCRWDDGFNNCLERGCWDYTNSTSCSEHADKCTWNVLYNSCISNANTSTP